VDDYSDIQLHRFCDASNIGYDACLYVRSNRKKGTVANLLCVKSRVAPLKTATIPRLELCALLLTQLYREVNNILNINPSKTTSWCDSTIVLQWLKTSPHMLKTFVANRVVEIQEHTTRSTEWRHVRSENNPADALSMGQRNVNGKKRNEAKSPSLFLLLNSVERR